MRAEVPDSTRSFVTGMKSAYNKITVIQPLDCLHCLVPIPGPTSLYLTVTSAYRLACKDSQKSPLNLHSLALHRNITC
jgi:hypothetical protein